MEESAVLHSDKPYESADLITLTVSKKKSEISGMCSALVTEARNA
jgi:hypothetical protein